MTSGMYLVICLSTLLLLGLDSGFCSRALSSDQCDPANQRDPRTLRWEQITVLINGYSEYRIPLLQSIAATYSASPLVSSVLVLWGNPSTPTQTLSQLSHNLSLSSLLGSASISLIRQSTSSLNARFLPRSSIGTHAVLICDDDVEMDQKSFEFAFRIWQSNTDRLIGVFVRSHDIDLVNKEWIYTVHPDKYSIALTKLMILKSSYLWEYSCGGRAGMSEMRRMVEEKRNCEDILMNFVIADEVNAGPIMVGAERVRDWGDARNDRGGVRSRISAVGLSSRKMEHRKRRGECISEFHRVLGRMPLRYSYGKVVNSVGEQGLCLRVFGRLCWLCVGLIGALVIGFRLLSGCISLLTVLCVIFLFGYRLLRQFTISGGRGMPAPMMAILALFLFLLTILLLMFELALAYCGRCTHLMTINGFTSPGTCPMTSFYDLALLVAFWLLF